MLSRQLRNIDGSAKLIQWLRGPSQPEFTLQCLIDMRLEPRWFPELASPRQLRNELRGRVFGAAHASAEAVETLGLKDRLLGDAPGSLSTSIGGLEAMLPGPLEGALPSRLELFGEGLAKIEADLAAATIGTSTFVGLINASMWWRIPDHLIEAAVAAITRHDYQIPSGDGPDLATCLLGLGSVAAVTRSQALCDAVRIVVRVSWRLYPGTLTADEAFRIGALACAAYVDATDWTKQIGHFMTELAMQHITNREARSLQINLSALCHLVPELWATCGQADAALSLAAGR